MRFAVAVLACALAVANAQLNNGAYNNNYNKFGFGNNQYRPGQYQPGGYNQRYQSGFNRFPSKPFVTSTPFPPRPTPARATAFVSVTPAPFVPVVPAAVVSPVTKVVVSVPKVAADARSAETLKSGYDISPDGSYNYYYETNNGIAAQAQGTPRNFGGNPPVVPDVAQGSFSWISPEGENIAITYVADENGYQPQGNALPVPPPLPPQIQRALEYVANYRKKVGA